LAATRCGENAPSAPGDDGVAAHRSRLANPSPALRSRRPFTSRWVCREAGVSLARQCDAVSDFFVGHLKRHKELSFRSDQRLSNGGFVGRPQPGEDRPLGCRRRQVAGPQFLAVPP
jgi:hypothetical protein